MASALTSAAAAAVQGLAESGDAALGAPAEADALGEAAVGAAELLGKALPVGKDVGKADGLAEAVLLGVGFAFWYMQSPDVTVAFAMHKFPTLTITCDGFRSFCTVMVFSRTRPAAASLYWNLVHTSAFPSSPRVLMKFTRGGGEIMQVEFKVTSTVL